MNKIPLSVSSTLTNVTSNALMVTPYGNMTGKTGTAAPVLIAVESEGTVDAAAFAAALPAKGGQGTASQARLVVNAIAGVLADLVAEYGAITVNTPFGRVDTFVAGSLEYATDPVDPAVNVPFLGIVPGADVMKAFSQIETFVPTAACPASLKRIRDVATEAHAIRGKSPFYAQGYGMTTGGAGETVKLLDLLTRAEVSNIAVDAATKSEAQFKCTIDNTAAVPAGAYLLQILTLAGGETQLWPLELKVNVTEAVPAPPTVTKVATPDREGVVKAKPFDATGANLSYDTARGDTAKVKWTEGSVAKEQSLTPTAVTRTKLSFAAVTALETAADDTALTFEFKINGVTVTQTATLLAREPIAQSASGDIKIYELGPMKAGKLSGPMKGVNVGLDTDNNNGIIDVRAVIGGKDIAWASSCGSGFEATEVNLEGAGETDLPPAGTYVTTLHCTRGHGEDPVETIDIPNVAVVVEA